MTGNWEIATESVPARFFLYADAYLEASLAVCDRMVADESSRTWPSACVAMMLAAHSVELFLKGAVLTRDSSRVIQSHTITDLKAIYDELYPEPEFAWETPFRTEYLGVSEEEAAALAKKEPVPSVLYRYPVNKGGTEWVGVHGFTPDDFKLVLVAVKKDYTRLYDRLRGI